jgi:GTPase SAR1 family protein
MKTSLAETNFIFKAIVVGDPYVGKSCILDRYLNDQFNDNYELTVGLEFGAKTIVT